MAAETQIQSKRVHRGICRGRGVLPCRCWSLRDDVAQAMVEFVIILFLVMILVSGMLYLNRLLIFDFWGEQEARYLAFEQTWVPHMAQTDAQGKVKDSDFFRRQALVDRLKSTRDINDDGALDQLVPSIVSRSLPKLGPDADRPISTITDSPVILARNEIGAGSSIWRSKTADWFGRVKRESDFVGTAFARENVRYSSDGTPEFIPNPRTEIRRRENIFRVPETEIEQGYVGLLQLGHFGERFCAGMENEFSRRGISRGTTEFSRGDCAEKFGNAFGIYLSQHVDLAQGFRDYGDRLEWGGAPKEALGQTIERVAATQFFSFFDTAVKNSMILALPTLAVGEAQVLLAMKDDSITRMIKEMRYVLSAEAVGGTVAELLLVGGEALTSPSADAVKTFEDDINKVMHMDMYPIGYLFMPTVLPVPVRFGSIGAEMMNGAMANFIFHEPDSGTLENDMITNSDKEIVVNYETGKGAFPAAARRFDVSNRNLTSRFYLVTQPWHIARQESATSGYRQIGDQFDGINTETEEGVLRRRVAGFWLLPSDGGAVMGVIKEIPGLGALGDVIEALRPLLKFVGKVKGFILDNPLKDFVNALHDIPIFGSLIPTFPEFPAVRPDAYPGTEEMKDDMMTTEKRTFKDYIEEQRKFNPSPNRDFHDPG